jgi:hypothetical protein
VIFESGAAKVVPMKRLLRLLILPILLIFVPALIAVITAVATGGRPLPFHHPVWLLLVVLLDVAYVLTLWQARSGDSEPDDWLGKAVRRVAETQRKRVKGLSVRGQINWDWPMTVTWLRNDERGPLRLLEDFIDWFVAELDVLRGPVPRAVVLGPKGSGKTSLATLLVDRLLEDTQAKRVPVLFRLASWDPHRIPLKQWLILRLAEDYPDLASKFGPRMYRRLVE